MEAGSSVSMRVITVITRRTQPCEALFFTRARKLHTNCRRTDFWRGMVRFAKASARQSSFDNCRASEGWRRGELNPCAHFTPGEHALSLGRRPPRTSPYMTVCCQYRCHRGVEIAKSARHREANGVRPKKTKVPILVRLFHPDER